MPCLISPRRSYSGSSSSSSSEISRSAISSEVLLFVFIFLLDFSERTVLERSSLSEFVNSGFIGLVEADSFRSDPESGRKREIRRLKKPFFSTNGPSVFKSVIGLSRVSSISNEFSSSSSSVSSIGFTSISAADFIKPPKEKRSRLDTSFSSS